MAKKIELLVSEKKERIAEGPLQIRGTSRLGHPYNWVPDLPDHRDYSFSERIQYYGELPLSVDLRKLCPPILDQGKIASSTCHAWTAHLEFLEIRELFEKRKSPPTEAIKPGKITRLSRLFIHFHERQLAGGLEQNWGTMLRDGAKSLARFGVCDEEIWKYLVPQAEKKPGTPAYKNARSRRISNYFRIRTLDEMRKCLAMKFPAVAGFTVFESFESQETAKSGILSLPEPDEIALGGHSALVVGYDDVSEHLILRNCWGPKWGQQGYFMMPYAYALTMKLAQDFWTARIG